jgi:hypothetical protein
MTDAQTEVDDKLIGLVEGIAGAFMKTYKNAMGVGGDLLPMC